MENTINTQSDEPQEIQGMHTVDHLVIIDVTLDEELVNQQGSMKNTGDQE